MSLKGSIHTAVQTLMHPSKRNYLYVLAIVWINAINFFVFYHRKDALNYVTDTIHDVVPLNNYKGHAIPKKLMEDVAIKLYVKHANLESDKRRIDVHSSTYDDLFAKHKVDSVLQLSYGDRCDAFFKSMYARSYSWSIDASDDFLIDMDYQSNWEKYKKKHWDETRQAIADDKKVDPEKVKDDDISKAVGEAYDRLKDKAKNDELTMKDQLANVRIFNKCYVSRDDHLEHVSTEKFATSQAGYLHQFSKNSKFLSTEEEDKLNTNSFDSCKDLESRVYPWLSFVYPFYERFTGEVLHSPPVMSKFVSDQQVNEPTDKDASRGKGLNLPISSTLTNNRACWLSEYKNKLNGKGIVVPVSLDTVDQAMNLINLLRALSNKFPIQMVYYGDLTTEQRKKLSDAAQTQFSDLPESYSKVQNKLPASYLSEDGLLKQELWFIDAKSIVNGQYADRMAGVPLSVMASFVSSFEEYILMDPSTVILQNPSEFFKIKGYRNTGAYFYRSRAAKLRPMRDSDFFKKLTPSVIDTTVFDIPFISSRILELPFFEGVRTLQDAGLAVINRARHFSTMATFIQLGMFWPANYRSNSGEEIWLAFAATGNDKFEFNKYLPAAIGTEVPQSDRLKPDGAEQKSHEICSSQTGHFDPEGSEKLTWFRGGFAVCSKKDVEFEKEFTNAFKWKHFSKVEELQHYYLNRIEITDAIIPPYDGTASLEVANGDNEPTSPWTIRTACSGLLYCGVSRVGGKDIKFTGQRIKFKLDEVAMFNYLGDIWVGNE